MKIKRFLTGNMRDAIRMVREELGPDAVILANHRVAGGVEVVAATDYDAALMQQAPRRAASTASSSATRAGEVPSTAAAKGETLNPAEPQPPVRELQQQRHELGDMRQMPETQLAGMAWTALRASPQWLRALQTMVDLGIDVRLGRELVGELPEATDAERTRFLLHEQTGTMSVQGHGMRAWLVLSAITNAVDLDEVVQRYVKAAPDACVLTKLDETQRIGGALSASIRNHLPIAYCCDGQRVPEDLEAARANSLVLCAMQRARTALAQTDDAALALQFGAIHAAH